MTKISMVFLSSKAISIIFKVCNLFGEMQIYKAGKEKNQFLSEKKRKSYILASNLNYCSIAI
jgi:hypothetical protein